MTSTCTGFGSWPSFLGSLVPSDGNQEDGDDNSHGEAEEDKDEEEDEQREEEIHDVVSALIALTIDG